MKLRMDLRWLGVVALAGLTWAGTQRWIEHRRVQLCAQEFEPPPPGMVLVPAGEFWMGSDDPAADPDERPLRKVFTRAFYIDRLEVTNRRYREFKPDHRYAAGEDELPVTFVLKRDAEAFCRWANRRLPKNAEWEKAARGTDGRVYPWGNEFGTNCANLQRRPALGPTNGLDCAAPGADGRGKRVGGSFPAGASPYGCHDMAGNVWEWVSDVWVDGSSLPWDRPRERRGIIRGGAYRYSLRQARTSYQGFESLASTCHDVGFRCSMDAVPKGNIKGPLRPAADLVVPEGRTNPSSSSGVPDIRRREVGVAREPDRRDGGMSTAQNLRFSDSVRWIPKTTESAELD